MSQYSLKIKAHYVGPVKENIVEVYSKFIIPVGLDETNLVLFQGNLKPGKEGDLILKDLSSNYRTKTVIVFQVEDYEGKYSYYENILLFRSSRHQKYTNTNEFTLPYPWAESIEAFPPIESMPKLKIGFCGQFGKNLNHRMRMLLYFKLSKNVEADYILRTKFWGIDYHNNKEVRKEYVDSFEKHAFILSPRGAGNFSMRHYESMNFGRIPVVINTDMILPFSSVIDWQETIVFEKGPKRCIKKMKQILSSGSLVDYQLKSKKIYDEYLSYDNFFKKVIELILIPRAIISNSEDVIRVDSFS